MAESSVEIDSEKHKRKHHIKPNVFSYLKRIHLSPRTKLSIIMGSFLLQWLPPAFLRVLNPYVTYVPPDVNYVIHW